MPNNYYESRKRWNAANYKQMNIAVRPELSEDFRKACEQNQIPMREVLTVFMAAYSTAPSLPKSPKGPSYNERRKRRKAVADILAQLEEIRNAEENYKENIPENFKTSSRYESAEHAVEALGEVIVLLESAFL